MSLISVFKLGAVNNLSDARYGAGVGAQYIGLNLNPESKDSLSAVEAPELIQWIQGPTIIGEFADQPADHINTVTELLGLDWAQIDDHGDADRIKQLDSEVVSQIFIDQWSHEALLAHLESIDKYVTFYLVNLKSDGIEEYLQNSSNRSFLKQIIEKYPVFFAFELVPDNVKPLIEEFGPHGINLSGSNEDRPGYKDFDQLIDLIEQLEKPEVSAS